MRDSSQLRAMDDYFHSLLLDDALPGDVPLPEVAWDAAYQEEPATVVPRQRMPLVQPESVVPAYLEVDSRLEQLTELLAQVGQAQLELDPPSREEGVTAPAPVAAEPVPLPESGRGQEMAIPSSLPVTECVPALTPAPVAAQWENIDTGSEFQALFFEVAGVTFAVPLTVLGGIHRLGEVSALFGQPAWYRGIMTSREQKMNVVDTARWVMPGQHPELPDYQYLIMLGESRWGLACHQLKGTELLRHDQVKWRHQEGKRPWLAGMVKEKMCALLHVRELLVLLERGVNIAGR